MTSLGNGWGNPLGAMLSLQKDCQSRAKTSGRRKHTGSIVLGPQWQKMHFALLFALAL